MAPWARQARLERSEEPECGTSRAPASLWKRCYRSLFGIGAQLEAAVAQEKIGETSRNRARRSLPCRGSRRALGAYAFASFDAMTTDLPLRRGRSRRVYGSWRFCFSSLSSSRRRPGSPSIHIPGLPEGSVALRRGRCDRHPWRRQTGSGSPWRQVPWPCSHWPRPSRAYCPA